MFKKLRMFFIYFFIISGSEYNKINEDLLKHTNKRKSYNPKKCINIDEKVMRFNYDYRPELYLNEPKNKILTIEKREFKNLTEELEYNKTGIVSSGYEFEKNTKKTFNKNITTDQESSCVDKTTCLLCQIYKSKNFDLNRINFYAKRHQCLHFFNLLLDLDKDPFISDNKFILFFERTIKLLETENDEPSKYKSNHEKIIDLFYTKKDENSDLDPCEYAEKSSFDRDNNHKPESPVLEQYKLKKEYYALNLFVPETFGLFFNCLINDNTKNNEDLDCLKRLEFEILNNFREFKFQYVSFLKSVLNSLNKHFKKKLKRPKYGIWYMKIIFKDPIYKSYYTQAMSNLRKFISNLSIVFLGVIKSTPKRENYEEMMDIIDKTYMFDKINFHYIFFTKYFYNSSYLTDDLIKSFLIKYNRARIYINVINRTILDIILNLDLNNEDFIEINEFVAKFKSENQQKESNTYNLPNVSIKKSKIRFYIAQKRIKIDIANDEENKITNSFEFSIFQYIPLLFEYLNYLVVQRVLE